MWCERRGVDSSLWCAPRASYIACGRRHRQDYQALVCGGAALLYHYPMTWIATTL